MHHNLPSLSLYIHLPWCVRKCPYCDFNSHAARGNVPEEDYIRALLSDLEQDLPRVWGRVVHTIFIGGGTPSLFSAAAMERLLDGVRARLTVAPGAEITLEANPGTVEHDRFGGYRDAGVNRISLGIQSFNDGMLMRLGRIHGRAEAVAAIEQVRAAGFDSFNLDLMFALPEQSVDQAVADIDTALGFDPPHISHYQLTLEPNTEFALSPPPLPDDEATWTMQQACRARLLDAGFRNYEVSAWTRVGRVCRHNLNYWRFGDYLGIGAGAHGKITSRASDESLRIERTFKHRHPKRYLTSLSNGDFVAGCQTVDGEDRIFEYFLNRFRLDEPVPLAEFEFCTGLSRDRPQAMLALAESLGLVELDGDWLVRTNRGERYLNDLQEIFLPAG